MNRFTSFLSERLLSISLALIVVSAFSLSASAQESEEEATEKGEMNTAAMEEANKPRPNIDTEKNSIQLLSGELEQSEQVWLKADGENFLALWQKDRTGNPFGAILILHGQGQTIDEPDEINALRLSLVHHGWATLSINLPGTKSKSIPPRPTPTPAATPKEEDATDEDQGKSGDAQQMAEDVEKQIPQAKTEGPASKEKTDPEKISKSRLDAAIQYLNQQGQYNIVIVGHGVAATRAMKYIQTISGGAMDKVKGGVIQRPIRAIIWVEARNRIPETQDNIQNLINDPNLPILDIYYNEHYLDAQEIKERYRSTRAQSVNHYYQVKMLRPSESNEDNENRLTRRVRGFLNKHAKGVEVER